MAVLLKSCFYPVLMVNFLPDAAFQRTMKLRRYPQSCDECCTTKLDLGIDFYPLLAQGSRPLDHLLSLHDVTGFLRRRFPPAATCIAFRRENSLRQSGQLSSALLLSPRES